VDKFRSTITFNKSITPTKKLINFEFFNNQLQLSTTRSKKGAKTEDTANSDLIHFDVVEHPEEDLVLLVFKQDDSMTFFQEFKLNTLDDDDDFLGGLINEQ